MAERLDPELERVLREESETLYDSEYLLSPVMGRPNLRPQHVVRLTDVEQEKLRQEALRRDLTEHELVRQWVAEHLV